MAVHLGDLTIPHSPRGRLNGVCGPNEHHARREISRPRLGSAPRHMHDSVRRLVDLGCTELINPALFEEENDLGP